MLETARKLLELKEELADAVRLEQFNKAAQLRDQIREMEPEPDRVASLQSALAAAVAEERYEDAARLRDELAMLHPHPPHFVVPPIASIADTEGVYVQAVSQFRPEQYRGTGNFLYTYRITVTNRTRCRMKIMDRRWLVTNAYGNVKIYQGPGVVGLQPEIGPGDSFTWESYVTLPTPAGFMDGTLGVYLAQEEAEPASPSTPGTSQSPPSTAAPEPTLDMPQPGEASAARPVEPDIGSGWTRSLEVTIGRFGLNAEA